MFKMEFSTENGIFQEDDIAEVSRLLNKVSDQVAHGSERGSIIDLNGNVVGEWSLEFDFEEDEKEFEEPDEDDEAFNLYEDGFRYVWSDIHSEWVEHVDVKWDSKLGSYVYK